jgi:hypothetical protein
MVLAFVVELVMLGYATEAHAAPGDSDFSFGSGGKVTTDFAASGEESLAVAVQDDDRVVVAGYAYTGTPAGYDLALARYNTNGAPYATFSGNGKVITPLGSSYEEAYGVAVQGTKIVVVGTSY